MIYLSAQPDDLYFLWQLEIQLHNFSKLGIPPNQIQILIAYKPNKGLRKEFEVLIAQHKKSANFFTYADERKAPKYESSIRPHILKKHFQRFPYLEEEVIFYHDSDIIFRERVDETMLAKGTNWYVSDTNTYLSPDYIQSFGVDILGKMCRIIDISPETVRQQANNSGGAQYILKNITSLFWEKIEEDSEALFNLLNEVNQQIITEDEDKGTIQAWCSDMWAVLWNGWKAGYEIRLSRELDFCWPRDPIGHWQQTKILHNAGVYPSDAENLFCKGLYTQHEPYFNNFSLLDQSKCSYKIVELIQEVASTKEKIDLKDVTFIIPIRIDSEDRLENLDISTRYLMKHFDTNILVIEADDMQRVNQKRLVSGVEYLFVRDEKRLLHRTKYLNTGIKKAITPIISIYDADVLLPTKQIEQAVAHIRQEKVPLTYPYDGRFIHVKRTMVALLKRALNCNSLLPSVERTNCIETSYGGCCFVDKNTYLHCGLENENFATWGPDDIERAKRVTILGYKIKRIEGPLFHMEHYRGISSSPTPDTLFKNDKEYIKICNYRKPELEQHISTWLWARTN